MSDVLNGYMYDVATWMIMWLMCSHNKASESRTKSSLSLSLSLSLSQLRAGTLSELHNRRIVERFGTSII